MSEESQSEHEAVKETAKEARKVRVPGELPRYMDVAVIPLINLLLAFAVAGLVVLSIGHNPIEAAGVLLSGAVGDINGIGFTLFYATSFIFTGLAVAVAFHAAQFNIGGEGQALFACIGVTMIALSMDQLPLFMTFPVTILAAMAFGGFWALIPAYLQAKRGSHIVITTIMLNFIAAAIVGYVVSQYFMEVGSGSPESRRFADGAILPRLYQIMEPFGVKVSKAVPLNIMFLVAIFALFAVWYLIWKTRLGYEIRAFGFSETAAQYGGISAVKTIIVAMVISGAIAGLMANNVVMGEQRRMGLDPIVGAGFVGIAVCLMGRAHPFGIFLAAVLFGMLYQGGAELAFVNPDITRDMIVTIQALVILFVGALNNLVRIPLTRMYINMSKARG